MIAKVYSAIPCGYDGCIVDVEGDIAKSLPAFNIVGMANKTITEARERVRAAVVNSGFSFPDKKVTINLAPAELAKDGSHLDLPIALAILILSGQLLQADLQQRLFVGELSLDGQTKPVRGIINILEAAKTAGFHEVYVPKANLPQAALISGISVIGINNLKELFLHLKGIQRLEPRAIAITQPVKNTIIDSPTLDEVRGQEFAKRAITIAIAGRHNILLSGPPGAGKTLLAKVAANLLPPPSPAEQIAITKIHALCGEPDRVIFTRPFRSPHHTASSASIIGGGNRATPGEVSLAHHGVLYLDEIPEYPRSVLESLRQPLEDRQITITRVNQHITYPSNFMLIATMNPCPCGYLGDKTHECTCTSGQIEAYRKRLSGPILDRIDLTINVDKVPTSDLMCQSNSVKNTSSGVNSSHLTALRQIHQALEAQELRFPGRNLYNSDLSSHDISVYVKITPSAKKLLQSAADALKLSARAYFKIIKVAQTIADLDGSTGVRPEHISESLSFRQQIR